MYKLLVSIAFTFLCLDAVATVARAHPFGAEQQETRMQYLDGFKFNQQQEQDQVTIILLLLSIALHGCQNLIGLKYYLLAVACPFSAALTQSDCTITDDRPNLGRNIHFSLLTL